MASLRFQREPFPGGLAAKWTAQQAKLVREGGFTDLAIELRLECDDHLDDNCPPWVHWNLPNVEPPSPSFHRKVTEGGDKLAHYIP